MFEDGVAGGAFPAGEDVLQPISLTWGDNHVDVVGHQDVGFELVVVAIEMMNGVPDEFA